MSRGQIIVLEGLEESVKQTQSELLVNRLNRKGIKTIKVSFHNYGADHSSMVESYLQGKYDDQYKFKQSAMTYMKQVAMMYTMDRVGTFITPKIEYGNKSLVQLLSKGYNIVCDRYTTSNLLHLSCNIMELAERKDFIKWIQYIEYKHLGIPEPNKIFYLDVPAEVSIENISKGEEITDKNKDILHLCQAYNNKDFIINYCKWQRVDCMTLFDKKVMRTVEEIHEEIYSAVISVLVAKLLSDN